LLAIVPQAHPPRYFFIGNDSADLAFVPQNLPSGWQQKVTWAHFGGISLARAPLAARLFDVAETLHRRGVTISFDPNHRNAMGPEYLATFERLCRIADVIKVSDEDLAGIYGSGGGLAAFARVRELNPQAWWLYTAGREGAILSTPLGGWQARTPQIVVVDTVGAGDACMAGLVASRLAEPEAAAGRHLGWAVASGSAACLAAGAVPPDRATVARLFAAVEVTSATSL
jgi:fructokinase